jgi:hypothetical protein
MIGMIPEIIPSLFKFAKVFHIVLKSFGDIAGNRHRRVYVDRNLHRFPPNF